MRPRWRPDTPPLRRAGRPRVESLGGSLDESFAESTPAAQPPFDQAHPAIIALVVVSEQVKQAVERKDPKLIQLGVAGAEGLASRHATGDDDLAQTGRDGLDG